MGWINVCLGHVCPKCGTQWQHSEEGHTWFTCFRMNSTVVCNRCAFGGSGDDHDGLPVSMKTQLRKAA